MLLFTIDSESSSIFSDNTYLPEDTILGWNSAIWTERYTDHSSFEIHLPFYNKPSISTRWMREGQLIGELGSDEIMMVETIEKSFSQEQPTIVVKGRSITSIFESRIVLGRHGKHAKMRRSYYKDYAIMAHLWNTAVNDTNYDVAIRNNGSPGYWNSWTSGFRPTSGEVPNSVVTDSTNLVIGRSVPRWTETGQVWDGIQKWLKPWYGFRVIRPRTTPETVPYFRIVTFTPADGSSSEGRQHTEGVYKTSSMRWDLYTARDMSHSVIFDAFGGHFDSPQNLESLADRVTHAWVMSSDNKDRIVLRDGQFSETYRDTGLQKKSHYVDGGSSEEGDGDFYDELGSAGERYLSEHQNKFLFTGQVSPNSPFVFGSSITDNNFSVDYRLGDTVGVLGLDREYRVMQVVEYTRTEDQQGERGFPTLVASEVEWPY